MCIFIESDVSLPNILVHTHTLHTYLNIVHVISNNSLLHECRGISYVRKGVKLVLFLLLVHIKYLFFSSHMR